MQKKLIALAIAGLASTSAFADVTVYGVLDAGIASISNVRNGGVATPTPAAPGTGGTVTGLQSGGMQTSRLGFKGSEDLGDGLKANFLLEAELLPQNGEELGATGNAVGTNSPAGSSQLFKRGAWVGLESVGLGEVRLGRQNTANYDYIGKYDAFLGGNLGAPVNLVDSTAAAGGSTTTAAGYTGNTFNSYGTDRYDNAVQLRSANLAGFNVRAGYSFGDTAGSTSAASIYDIGAEYAVGPLQVAAAYQSKSVVTTAATATANAADSQATTSTGVYALFDAGVAKFNVDYTKTSGKLAALAADYTTTTLGARVPVTASTTLMASFSTVKNTQSGFSPKEFALGVQHDFTKTTAVYAMAAVANQDGTSALNTVSTSKFVNSTVAGDIPVFGQNQTAIMLGINKKF